MDYKNIVSPAASIAPAAITATATGAGVDLANFSSAMVIIHPGTITDGTHTPKVQESADNTTFTDVAAADQEGTLAAIATGVIQRVGYKGGLRYVRVVATVAGATTGGVYGAAVLRLDPRKAPTA